MKQGGNGEDGDAREISPVTAKKGMEITPSNAKDPASFDSSRVRGMPEKSKGTEDTAWYQKNAGPGYHKY